MSFVSASFLALYVAALALRFGVDRSRSVFVVGLLALSWVFYSWHVPHYLVLILFSTGVDYVAARVIGGTPREARRRRRAVLGLSLAVNLGLLGYYKYAAFAVDSAIHVADGLGLGPLGLSVPAIVLPIGISFYTFQSLSYTIDVYRGHVAAERSFVKVACYVAFFPQLVAGPIVRAGDFLYQLGRRRPPRLRVFLEGAYLMLRGAFLKTVVADNLGLIVDANWERAAAEPGGVLAASVCLFFAVQLFCDFAGYSDIARGLAYQLGFRLPVNFDSPYVATSFAGFWRRWHISLSTWFRDYLYIPLGGNRRGPTRAMANLLVVMLVSGLWHGASWTFVVWGAIHGVAVALERLLERPLRAFPRRIGPAVLRSVVGWAIVQGTWVLSMGVFRADGIDQGAAIVRNALVGLAELPTRGTGLDEAAGSLVGLGLALIVPAAVLHLRTLVHERAGVPLPRTLERTVLAGAMLAAVLMLYTQTQTFIYFQF